MVLSAVACERGFRGQALKIGAETVAYVSNIYKYYIAYTLIMESRAEKEQAIKQMKGQSQ